MKFHKWLARFFLAGLIMNGMACAPKSNEENFISTDNAETSSAIINGANVANNNPIARSIVAIYNDQTKTICTGSLLANNLVLTAAHCTTSDPRYLYIIFETDFSSSEPAKVRQYKMRQVTHALASPVWKRQEHLFRNQGDIGLLKFYGPVPYGYVPATLLTDFSVLKKGVPVVIAGYGVNNAVTRSGHRILRQTVVAMENPEFSNLEMSVDQSKGQGACSGDSGGPAYVFSNGRYYLWGVINRGYYNEDEIQRQKQAETKAANEQKINPKNTPQPPKVTPPSTKPQPPKVTPVPRDQSQENPSAAEQVFSPEYFCNKQGIMTRIDIFRSWIQSPK